MPSLNFLWGLAILFCGSARAASAVQPAVANYTIDDRSSAVNYTQGSTQQCPAGGSAKCPSTLFDGTSTVTSGPIHVNFSGIAVYVFLGIAGAVTFALDGNVTDGMYNNTDDSIHLAFSNPALFSGPHLLTISPVNTGTIQLDYIVYTGATGRKTSRNKSAIIGGVVGGVLVVALILIALFLCRRQRRKRRLQNAGPDTLDSYLLWLKMRRKPPTQDSESLDASSPRVSWATGSPKHYPDAASKEINGCIKLPDLDIHAIIQQLV
ncbi:hypothetical protein C8R44DRAFT_726208 [Mycena epipterygia]|nr:hypothetical protein C8R44DRAFT_726208 [Mycena epipterygia]